MDYLLEEDYESEVCGDIGFTYQEELLLHFCLLMRKMNCDDFAAGYEVKNIPKFDDVVFQYKVGAVEHFHQIMVQSKYVHSKKKVITKGYLFATTSEGLSKRDTDFWNRFNLKQYFKAIIDITRKSGSGCVQKFVILTNTAIDMTDLDTILENNNEFDKLFCEMVAKGTEIKKFTSNSKENLKTILNVIGIEDADTMAEFIIDNFIFVVKSPDVKDLEALNNMLMEDIIVANQEWRRDVLDRKMLQFIEIQGPHKKRKVLRKADFECVLMETVLEVENLTDISANFLQEMPFEIEFKDELASEIVKNTIISDCEESLKINTIRVFQSINKHSLDTLLVPLSRLNQLQRSALRSYTKKIVLLVDEDCVPSFLRDNDNIIFVQTRQENLIDHPMLPQFSISDLTQNTIDKFIENAEISLQKHKINLKSIENRMKNNYIELLTKFIVKLYNKNAFEMGQSLPKNRIPVIFIERRFSNTEDGYDFLTDNILTKYSRCIVKGGPGMGKSSTLQKMMTDFKRKNPHFWVEFFELRALSDVFMDKLKAGSSEFSYEEAREFLLDNLMNYDDCLFDRELLEYYLTLENPAILLIFDGFDEIMPTYEELVLNLITKISGLNVKIFISGRLHCTDVLKRLTNFSEVYLSTYNVGDAIQFLDRYCAHYISEPSVRVSIGKVMKDIVYFFELQLTDQPPELRTKHSLFSTPLILKLMADVVLDDYEQSPGNLEEIKNKYAKFSVLYIYNRIFEQSFRVYYEKEGIPPTNNYVIKRKMKEIERVRKIYASIAAKDLGVVHLVSLSKEIDDDSEILERGFVARVNDKEPSFVQITFAEYFISTSLVDEIQKGNERVMKHLYEMKYEYEMPGSIRYREAFCHPVKDFTYQILLEKIQLNEIIIKSNVSDFNCLFSFLQDLIIFSYSFYDQHLSRVLSYVRNFLNKEDKEYFDLVETAFMLRNLPFSSNISAARFQVLLNLIEQSKDVTKVWKFLNTCKERSLQKCIQLADMPSIEQFYVTHSRYDSSSVRDYLHEVLNILKNTFDHFLSGNSSNEKAKILFFWYFDKLYSISNDYFAEINDELVNILNPDCFPIQYMYFLYFYESDKHKSEEYLKTFWRTILSNKDEPVHLLLLENLLQDGFYLQTEKYENSPQFFTEKSLLILKNMGYNFIMPDESSILYPLFITRKNRLFQVCLDFFSREEIIFLTDSPHFEEKSLVDYYHKEQKIPYTMSYYIKYLYDNHEDEELLKYLPSYDQLENFADQVRKDLRFCVHLGPRIVKRAVEKVCNNALKWDQSNEKKTLFLHNAVKALYNKQATTVIDLVLNYLKAHNLFLEKFFEKDTYGNLPIHICAVENNHFYLEKLLASINFTIILDALEKINDRNQNFFHCVKVKIHSQELLNNIGVLPSLQKYVENLSNSKEVKDKLSKLLCYKDKSGKLPLHQENIGIFIPLISEADIEFLYTTVDKEGCNAFHYFSDCSINSMHHSKPIEFIETLKSVKDDAVEAALMAKNCRNETPLDICIRDSNELFANIIMDILKM